jgi:uncharacterized membrane protein YdfJ with MMPL/SSD domain
VVSTTPKGARGFAEKYTAFVSRFRLYIIGAWVLLTLPCLYFGPALLWSTKFTWQVPTDAPVLAAERRYRELFPDTTQQTDFGVMVRAVNGSASVVGDARTRAFVDAFGQWVANRTSNDTELPLLAMTSYFALDDLLQPSVPPLFRRMGESLQRKFVSNDSSATIVTVTINADPTHAHTIEFADAMSEFVRAQQWDGVVISVSGISAFLTLMQASVESDLIKTDGISMPIAILILAVVLKSVRLLIVPLTALLISCLCSFALTYIVAQFLDVIFITPSLMMSLLVASSIDSSLFLLSRYREELLDAQRIDQHAAVVAAMRTGGHTVFVSGLTLSVCFAGLILLPLSNMQSLGIGASLAILVATIVNLTLVPALLLTAKNFFWRCVKPTDLPCCNWQFTWGARADLCKNYRTINDDADESIGEPGIVDGGFDAMRVMRDEQRAARACWYRVGGVLTRLPYSAIVLLVVVGAAIYPSLFAIGYAVTNSVAIFLPRTADNVQEYLKMGDLFGYGTVYPYKLAFTPQWTEPAGNWSLGAPAISERAFLATQRIVRALSTQMPNLTIDDVQTLSFIGGEALNYNDSLGFLGLTIGDAMIDCINNQSSIYTMSQCTTVRSLLGGFVAPSFGGWIAILTPRIDTQNTAGGEWLKQFRTVAAQLGAQENITLSVLGMSAYTWDAVWAVEELFPIQVGATAGVVLLFVGIAFRSVLVPIVAVLSSALTLAFVFGFADLTYQHGVFDWLGFAGLSSSPAHALLWMCPLLSFSVIVGISTDYTIFGLSRMQEFRQSGLYDTRQSTAHALDRGASVINAAGVIMAIGKLSKCLFLSTDLFFPSILGSFVQQHPQPESGQPVPRRGSAVRHVCGAHVCAHRPVRIDRRRSLVAGATDATEAARGTLDVKHSHR